MSRKIESRPELGLSLQFVTADAVTVDWSRFSADAIRPAVTYGDVNEYAPDLLMHWFNDGPETPAGTAPLSDAHRREFEDSDAAYADWHDSFEPVMNYAWPVSLAYGVDDVQAVVATIARVAPACVLVEFTDVAPWGDDSDAPEYGIALTGGGMDLSDHIALAYLAAGCVPSMSLLQGLTRFTGPNRSACLIENRDLLAEAFDNATQWLMDRADSLNRAHVALSRDA